ncbi:MAG: pantetheine-phosphate adenylyltransferase [Thermoplasmata archaeon]|nr:pantetheine-phosphate adenylyltransferase [Thermoplasmata archaeon]
MSHSGRGNICIGGTFWPLHQGHRSLLDAAFRNGNHVGVGLTADEMAASHRNRYVAPLTERSGELVPFLDELSLRYGVGYVIEPITDIYGFAISPKYTAIVVSRETESAVDLINEERARNGLPPLRRVVVEMVKDDQGQVISSTRVQMGEVSQNGRSLPKQDGGKEGKR